jgi:hypothetical protein
LDASPNPFATAAKWQFYCGHTSNWFHFEQIVIIFSSQLYEIVFALACIIRLVDNVILCGTPGTDVSGKILGKWLWHARLHAQMNTFSKGNYGFSRKRRNPAPCSDVVNHCDGDVRRPGVGLGKRGCNRFLSE